MVMEKLKELKVLNDYIPFIVCKNRNRLAPVRELLSNISLFVGQLYADKSLALRTRDLLSSTTDLQNSDVLFLHRYLCA